MADHVDANPTKGAGKSPRVPRTTRKASLIINKTTLSSSASAIRVSIPTKRKSRNRETNDLRGRKVPRVEELLHQKHSKSRSVRSSSSNQSIRKQKEEYRSGRFLRKRKRNIELGSSSSDSDQDSVTTDPENDELFVRVEVERRHHHPNLTSFGDVPVSTSSNRSSASSTVNSGNNKHLDSSKEVNNTKHPSSSGTCSSKNSERQLQLNLQKFNHNSPSNSNSNSKNTSQRRSKVHKVKSIETPSKLKPKDSQQLALESTSISSRLRLTPSRAAAAASQKAAAELGSLKNKLNNSPSTTVSSLSRGKQYSKQIVSDNKKKSHRYDESNNTVTTDELTEDADSSLPGPSTKSNPTLLPVEDISHSGFRYQLRSRTSVDGSQTSSTSTSSAVKDLLNKKDKLSRRESVASGLRGAHILSEKEKGLRRSTTNKNGGGDLGSATSSSSSNNNNSSAVLTGVQSTSSGRSSGRGAPAATSNTTGSCASSRCGRGGPSSTEGPSSVTVKSGEPGMNNSPSSGGQQQSTSSSSRIDQPDGDSSVSATSASTGNASAAAASAFSRGLAMLSGEADADEGEMGRLQALLESRGLPPHLFGSLAPRMQQLLHRGISNSTGNVTKAQQLLQGLQATGDEGQQLQAAIEMCQLLVMGNEDTLAGFPVKQTVPALIQLLSMEHNFDIMNHACRALTYMMEALPRSTPVVAEAVPVFLEKLQVIQCMDVAEQSLTALEMLSRRHAKAILQARGVSACLTFLDFFSIVAQRASLSITANCMQNLHSEEFPLVADSLHFMATRLTQQDKKSVESTCLAFSRLVDSFNADPKRLEEIASPDLLANLQQLLVVTPPVVSTGTFILVLRMLAQLCARSPSIAVKLLEQNIVGTLSSLLLGSSGSSAENVLEDVELVPRNPQELLEIVALIAELLPKLPKDGIFIVNTMMANPQLTTQDAVQWQWKDDRGQWNSYSPFDSRIIEAAHQSGEDEISLSMQGRTYTVDFLGMQQINEDTGTARTVQRKVNPFYCLKSGGSSAGVVSESHEKNGCPDDERSSYLSVHPDFSLSFLRPLFALLSEANSSSAGPAVRQSCLKTLLRIVHFLPPDTLQKALKPQLVSNNLASMLGSSDLKIVVGSFQLCCLFMEKLHEDFLIHFRREGVFHQISRISSSEVVGPSPMKSDITALLGMSPPGSLTSVSAAGSSNNISSGGISNNLNNVSGAVSSTSSMTVLPSVSHLPISVMNVNVPIPPPLTPLQMQIQPMSMHHHSHAPHLPPSPYSLCVGGFFMQQPGMSNLVGGSPAAAGTRSDNGNFVGGLNLSTVLEASRSVPDPSGREIINVQPSSGQHGVTNVVNSITSVIHTASIAGMGSSGSVTPSTGNQKSDRGGSGTSSSDFNVESSNVSGVPSGASRSGSSSGHDKKIDDSTQALYDAFKRKRVSKRPIPTSTSRRLRQEDPAGNNTPSPGNSNHSTGSSGGAQSGKRGGKSGFFASLHPSRWTRGGAGNGSSGSASNNNTPNSVANLHSDRSHHVSLHGHVGGPGGMSFSSSSRSHNVNSVFTVSYKEQVKTWLKEQSLAFTTKYCRSNSESGVTEPGTITTDEVGVLPKLSEIILHLRQEAKMIEALKELRTVILESDISSFEINHSGLIPALLGFLTDENGYKSSRDSRLRSFIHTFAECPLNHLSGEELDAYIGARSGGNALSSLVAKLNSCLAQVEQFQVKVHEVPTSSGGSRAAPTSALRFFNTHQLKCTLQRHPSCSTLRQWKGGPVKIDSLALVQTIERYLIAKGFGRIRESRDSGDSEDDNSDDDIDDTLAAAVISQGNARHKLQFLMGEHVLPYNMTVYQAIRQFGMGSSDPSGELEAELDPASALLGSSGIWAQTHTIYYRPVPEDGSSSNASSTTASKSKKSKAPAKNTSKSKKDPLWHEGQVPDPTAPYLTFLTGKLPESVTIVDPCLPVLTLLRVIHSVCRFWRYLYWPVLSGQPLLPQSEFINTKVAAKAQRQLQDPVVIMTGNVPQWLQQIGVCCPFLFPFETRQMLFYSITFDRDRALQRLLDSVPELNSSEREDRVTPRLDRRKRTISRDNILHHAEQLMSDFGSSRPLLEIQYENEVGTGLGPTLEFYALVSQELQKKELDLWHCESSVDVSIPDDAILDSKAKNYVHTSVGLFPKPLGKSVKAGSVSKIKSKFKFLGKFMAKAVMDSRMIDLPLSKTLYKWILTGEMSMCLADICDVDSTIARSIRHLVSVVSQKKKLEAKFASNDLNAALESLTLDGCRIDNLGLDFTLPGHPSIDLKKGGKDIPVTIHNLEDYIKLVCHWMLLGGVSRQMEAWKEGFDSVFPSSSLKMFYPEELEMIFCGANQSANENWDIKTLMECCRADHGYTLESRAIQFLFEIMSSYDAQERRKCIQFVTGSPRLPVGGFKSLQPQLTIVRKTVEGQSEDSYLPSVMTCVNYLKLPDYSTLEVMRERLQVAVDEGQLSFHLS